MQVSKTIDISLIAPCGINCWTCIAYLRARNKCCGCRAASGPKVNHCEVCKIKNCDFLESTVSKFCYDCGTFPCKKLKHIDKRYRIKYKSSLIQNLVTLKEVGINEYLKNEISRWTCPNCGSTVSVHRENCPNCDLYLNKTAIK